MLLSWNTTALPIYEINNRHMTYIIDASINNCLSVNCNTYVIIMEHYCYYLPAVVVVLVYKPIHRMASIVFSHFR